ncbi:hypothetical protein C0J52_09400 [Blattella germanica]|nr:hypothetical protein C0J52_09400 [Blattella germanica]
MRMDFCPMQTVERGVAHNAMKKRVRIERDPKKRRVKPVGPAAHQSLLDFDLGESSDDSDFRIEDHFEESDDDSIDSDDDGRRRDVIQQAKQRQADTKQFDFKDAVKVLICCGCLGDRSDDANEIVECDGCGVTVHEGGIFKETDVGKWVHLVCALYVPGVAFGEVDKLSSVTLFEMPYSKWGAKTCSLCEDARFSRTGVCIGCDAGMCRTFFHVTWRRRRNWLALQLRTKQRAIEYQQVGHSNSTEQLRIQRKLAKYRQKYLAHKTARIPPWVPTQKMPRLLTTSASAYRKLLRKAELMGIDTQALEIQEAQVAALVDVRKKWHIQPAFSVEFIGYYLDRNVRLTSMKRKLEDLLEVNNQLQDEQQMLRHKYDQVKSGPIPLNECGICRQTKDQHLLAKCDTCHLFYHLGCLNPPLTRMPKKTKLMGWQCSECDKESSGSEIECVDTEAPRRLRHAVKEPEKLPGPLTPKVTIKPIEPQPVGPPRPAFTIRGVGSPPATVTSPTLMNSNSMSISSNSVEHQSQRQGKKRRREKHHRYSPDSQGMSPSKEHKRKRKRKSFDMENPNQETPRIKIKIKPIPMPIGEGASSSGPQMFVATSSTETVLTPSPIMSRAARFSGGRLSGPKKPKDADVMTKCDVCNGPGSNDNLVRCDECMKCFHFTCLDPPVKKTPKRRGYSWHCADCDPTVRNLL